MVFFVHILLDIFRFTGLAGGPMDFIISQLLYQIPISAHLSY